MVNPMKALRSAVQLFWCSLVTVFFLACGGPDPLQPKLAEVLVQDDFSAPGWTTAPSSAGVRISREFLSQAGDGQLVSWTWTPGAGCMMRQLGTMSCGGLLTDGTGVGMPGANVSSCLSIIQTGSNPCTVTLETELPKSLLDIMGLRVYHSMLLTFEQSVNTNNCIRKITVNNAPAEFLAYNSDSDSRDFIVGAFHRDRAQMSWTDDRETLPVIKFELAGVCDWRFSYIQALLIDASLP